LPALAATPPAALPQEVVAVKPTEADWLPGVAVPMTGAVGGTAGARASAPATAMVTVRPLPPTLLKDSGTVVPAVTVARSGTRT